MSGAVEARLRASGGLNGARDDGWALEQGIREKPWPPEALNSINAMGYLPLNSLLP